MVIALVILAVLLGAAIALLIYRERELRRMARFLHERPRASNARMTTSVRSTGSVGLTLAVNEKLDDIGRERIDATERERELQRTLTSLSHDIRTPLSGAQGYLELLEGEFDDQKRERYLGIASKRLEEVRNLLDELFAYTRAQDAEYLPELEPVDLGAALGEVLMSFYPQFAEKGWEPSVSLDEVPCVVQTDREALDRIFRNLVVNTLRHGADAPRIVQCGTTVKFANRVQDSAPLDAERMFDRFYRGDAARAAGGTGLGLAIVSELSRALGITVKASSAGSALSISLVFND